MQTPQPTQTAQVIPFPGAAPPEPNFPSLESSKRLFVESRDMTRISRLRSLLYRRYYDGDQWTEKERRTRDARHEPSFVINRVRPGVEGMVGVVEKGKSVPRAYPRNPQNEDASEVATDVLRFVHDENRWHQSKLKAFRNILVEGTAAIITEVDAKLNTRFRRIRFEEFFYDPYSREPDFSDASYMGIAKWQFLAEVQAAYPEMRSELESACSSGDFSDRTWSDRPTNSFGAMWTDPKRKRLLVVEIYRLYGGQWLKCCFVSDLKLCEEVSPYLDNDDKPCNPIEAYSAYIDDENRRYGVVEDMLGPQDEINIYRNKAAWLATFRQLQETDPSSAGIDPDEARKEAARPDGVIPAGWGVVSNNDRFQMDSELLQEAKSEIERMGPNPAIVGRASPDASGRATLVRQQAGLTELAHLFSGLEDLEMRVFKQAWARTRQFATEPKFIRVTENPNAFRWVQINEPVLGPPAPVMDPQTGQYQTDPATGQIVMQPQMVGVKNAVARMEVDIIIDSTPDTANVQQEQYNALVQLAQIPGTLGPNPGKILLQASSLPMKHELIDQLEQEQQAAAQAQAAAAQQPPTPERMLAIRGAQANIEKTVAQGHEANARAAKLITEAHHAAAAAPIDRAVEFTKAQEQQAHAATALLTARSNALDAQGSPTPAQPDF